MAETSQLTRASLKSESLRATVPKGIVQFLRLGVGESISWEMEIINGKRVAVIRPVQDRLQGRLKIKEEKF